MLIKIETDFLIKYNLTVNQYFLLLYMTNHETNINDLATILTDGSIDEAIQSLKADGWLTDSEKFEFTEQTKNLFDESSIVNAFDKIYFKYPQKVFRKRGGFRVLRAATKESTEYNKCLQKYTKLVKNQPWLSDTIEHSLDNQLQVLRNNEGLEYLQEFEVWLNNSTWEKYIKVDKEEAVVREKTHGI